MTSPIVTLREAFAIVCISRGKGYQLIAQGRFAPVRYLDGKALVLRRDLERWLAQLPTVRSHRRGGIHVASCELAAPKRRGVR